MHRNLLMMAALGLVLNCLAHPACTEPLAAVRTAYNEGRFVEAAELGEALGTPEALTLANRSLVYHAYYHAAEDDKLAVYERAMGLGGRAARLAPEDAQSLVYWSQAIGRYIRQVGAMKVLGSGLIGQVRELLETALALEPSLAVAHTTLGAWHAEAINEGRFMARALFGASGKKAREHFERAIELAPDVKEVVYEYGRGQLNLHKRKNRERALKLFERALAIPASNAADRLLDQRIRQNIESLHDSSSGRERR